jgi:hypothetical protein
MAQNIADFSTYARWAMRDALENVPDPRSKAFAKQGPVLDFYLPIAGIWLTQVGPRLKASEPAEKWQSWKKRFEEIAVLDQVSDKTREMAQTAASSM